MKSKEAAMSALDLNLSWEEFVVVVEEQKAYAEALEHPVLPLYLLEDPARDLVVVGWRFEATLAALLRESFVTEEVDRYDGDGNGGGDEDGDGNGDGSGYGNGYGDGNGYGGGRGSINGGGDGDGNGFDDGDGFGNGNGNGSGDGFSNGNGYYR